MGNEILTKIGEKAEWTPMSESGGSGGSGTEIIDGCFDYIENPTAIIFENGETYATVCQKAKENPNIILRMSTDSPDNKVFFRLGMCLLSPITDGADDSIYVSFEAITYGDKFWLHHLAFNSANTNLTYYTKSIT